MPCAMQMGSGRRRPSASLVDCRSTRPKGQREWERPRGLRAAPEALRRGRLGNAPTAPCAEGRVLAGMVLPIRTIAVLLLAALLALGGCGRRGAPPARPNIVLISIDTLRPDHLGCYGYERRTSPHIDRLAERGIVFEDAMSASCWTLPSHATMLTGLYPSFHGLQDDGEGLPESIPTLAEELRRSGYRTLAAVSHVYVSSTYRLDRGFDRFDDSLIRGGAENPRAAETVDRALALFDGTPEGPFFLFVHFFDPHSDYEP
ncbi:MAG: hypothetical protein EHM19_08595, partial [Candidatus Latescibacterota bacterium]